MAVQQVRAGFGAVSLRQGRRAPGPAPPRPCSLLIRCRLSRRLQRGSAQTVGADAAPGTEGDTEQLGHGVQLRVCDQPAVRPGVSE